MKNKLFCFLNIEMHFIEAGQISNSLKLFLYTDVGTLWNEEAGIISIL